VVSAAGALGSTASPIVTPSLHEARLRVGAGHSLAESAPAIETRTWRQRVQARQRTHSPEFGSSATTRSTGQAVLQALQPVHEEDTASRSKLTRENKE
jgi:hypothetical protein